MRGNSSSLCSGARHTVQNFPSSLSWILELVLMLSDDVVVFNSAIAKTFPFLSLSLDFIAWLPDVALTKLMVPTRQDRPWFLFKFVWTDRSTSCACVFSTCRQQIKSHARLGLALRLPYFRPRTRAYFGGSTATDLLWIIPWAAIHRTFVRTKALSSIVRLSRLLRQHSGPMCIHECRLPSLRLRLLLHMCVANDWRLPNTLIGTYIVFRV